MKKLLFVSMVALFVLGCAAIPEEWIPLVGKWDLSVGVDFLFSRYTKIYFNDGSAANGLYGEGSDEDNNYRFYCVLTEDNPDPDYNPDQYKYYAAVYGYNRELGEDVWVQLFYFNMLDDNNIEGVFMDVSFLFPSLNDWIWRPFQGAKR